MEDEARAPVANDPASGGGGPGEVNGNNLHDANGGSVTAAVEMKRKRGRPSKSPDQAQRKPVMVFSPPLGFPSPNPTPPVKRGRGRPKGSVSRPRFPLLTPPGFADDIYVCGVVLTPHILPIYPGEDVHGRILSFAQSGCQAVNVLSCTGPVASISICSPGSTGGMIYEGRFEILTLNGSFTCAGSEGSYHRKGRLTVTLAKPNGQVLGGCVSGPIIAAGPIQLVLGSYDQVRRPSAAPFTAPKASDHCQGAGQDNMVSSLKSEAGNFNNGGNSPSGVPASAPRTGVTSSPQHQPQPQPEPAVHRDTEGQVDEAPPLDKSASNVSDQ